MKHKFSAAIKHYCAATPLEKCNQLAYLCLCLFILDVSIAGGGRYLMIGPFSIRMLLGFFALILSIPCFLQKRNSFLRSPILQLFGIFLVYLLICAVRGQLGSGKINVIISDVRGFAWLFLVPVMTAQIKNRRKLETILSVIVIGGVIQATIVHLINFLCAFHFCKITAAEATFVAVQLGVINHITDTFYRIFMNSCPYLALACAIALFRQMQAGRILWKYVFAITWMVCAALLSFTRSLYGCFFLVGVLTVIGGFCLFYTKWKQSILLLAVTIATTGCFIFAAEFIFNANYLNFAVSRTFGTELHTSPAMDLRDAIDSWLSPEMDAQSQQEIAKDSIMLSASRDGSCLQPRPIMPVPSDFDHQKDYMDATLRSDELRQQTQTELWELIALNPIFGNGLGAYAPVRDTGADLNAGGYDEYFYLDMLARTGILGLLLYILPFGYTCLMCLKKRNQLRELTCAIPLMCGMLGFWAITWFNPWMNAVIGISAYALCCTIVQLLQTEANKM